jgi:hypothetical protein
LFKLSLIFFILLFSYLLSLTYYVYGVSYLKGDLETYLFDLKNYFVITDLISQNIITSVYAQTIIGGNLPPINDSNTFYTKGVLSSVLFPNYDTMLHHINASSILPSNDIFKNQTIVNTSLYEFPKLISGTWRLNVTQGNTTNFYSAFKLVTTDGLEKHFVELNNFQGKNTSIVLNPYTSTTINGYVNIKIDNQLFESHLPIKIELNRINTIIIHIDKQSVSDLLFKNPIYGVVNSFKNFNNDELLVLNNQ